MNAYTVSRLAQDAGVSVHVVRDYLLRGLLRPAARTAGGYGVFDADALQRLRFVRAAFEAADAGEAAVWLAELRQLVERRQRALAGLEVQLSALRAEVARQEETLP